MSLKVSLSERVLHFRQPAGTSRGIYTERRSWFVDIADGDAVGHGECAPLPDLSCDALPPDIYKDVLEKFCREVEQTGEIPYEAMRDYPSMLFGLETAMLDVNSKKRRSMAEGKTDDRSVLFDTPFARGEVGIPINGLVWMGTFDEMSKRIEEKLVQGFRCIKLKIGAIDFDSELALIKQIRSRFSRSEVELRVDANGAFDYADGDALYKLELLSQFALHSIEQPIKAGQWANMAELCRESPLPIALDEELIGVNDPEQKRQLLHIIKPAFIVLKPSLHGGMAGCREWIETARQEDIGSWITSALESNVGLNAIAQFCSNVYGPHLTMPQGPGSGQLFTDNIPMPIEISDDRLWLK
jgi:o-succinylbenzoate synthase